MSALESGIKPEQEKNGVAVLTATPLFFSGQMETSRQRKMYGKMYDTILTYSENVVLYHQVIRSVNYREPVGFSTAYYGLRENTYEQRHRKR